jgi:2-desacetyl-2-hydroxyethyl bacteriochlorophyllide A dehydrogenase
MKMIVCEQPDQFVLKEMEAPTAVSGQALIRIRRIGICGTDLHAYKGRQPFFSYPRVLGHELSGEIMEIGSHEGGLQIGDPVVIIPYQHCGSCIACRSGKTNCCTKLDLIGVHSDGGMCEVIAHPTSLLIKAEGIGLEQAAIVECLAIGAHAVRRSELQPQVNVLVIGSGPIGLGVMKFAKLAGARVIAMDINEERLAYCARWAPVDETINALNNPLDRLLELTQGELPTVVFDATGNAKSMMDAFQYTAHGGKLVFVGLVKQELTFNDPEFHKREMTLLSSRNATRVDFEKVMQAMADGHIDTDSYITHRCPFDAMIGEFDSWLKPETGVIKAMVEL